MWSIHHQYHYLLYMQLMEEIAAARHPTDKKDNKKVSKPSPSPSIFVSNLTSHPTIKFVPPNKIAQIATILDFSLLD